jgi:gamma-glutamyltranspeptidase/glutathione hydrolase
MAAAMNVVEPCSTGLGGDAFALYYEASSQQVHCLMGNGAAPEGLSFEHLDSVGIGIKPGQQPMDLHSGLTVTVPGAARLWSDLVSAMPAMWCFCDSYNSRLWVVLHSAVSLSCLYLDII